MHNIESIVNNIERFLELMSLRKVNFLDQLKGLPELSEKRKSCLTECQKLEQANNIINSKEIPLCKKNNIDIADKIIQVQENNIKIKDLTIKINESEKNIKFLLENCPNLPLCDDKNILIPIGDEEQNKEISIWGKIREFTFQALAHDVIGEKLGLMDFKQTAKISGSRFVTLKGKIAKLEQALINFMIDAHTKEHGYELVSPPYLVKESAMYGVGQLPKFSEESFVVSSGPAYGCEKIIENGDGYRLIPTAEVSLTNLVSDMIIDNHELPLRYVAVTPCFRSEIGSAGRDVTGIIRLHQFTKVELVSLVSQDEREKIINEDINSEMERMTRCACVILEKLNLPYRVVLLATGDTGFSSRKTYDLEVWMPAQNKYREISSCSYFDDFQARRMNARYKDENKKNQFLHSLNGSALAIGRTIAAIIENYQTIDGDFEIPEVLKKYM